MFILNEDDVELIKGLKDIPAYLQDPKNDKVPVLTERYISFHEISEVLWWCNKLGIATQRPKLDGSGRVFEFTMYGEQGSICRFDYFHGLITYRNYSPSILIRQLANLYLSVGRIYYKLTR